MKEHYWRDRYSDGGLGHYARESYLDRYQDFYYSLPKDNPKLHFFETFPNWLEILECYERDCEALENQAFWGVIITFHNWLFAPLDWLIHQAHQIYRKSRIRRVLWQKKKSEKCWS